MNFHYGSTPYLSQLNVAYRLTSTIACGQLIDIAHAFKLGIEQSMVHIKRRSFFSYTILQGHVGSEISKMSPFSLKITVTKTVELHIFFSMHH